MADVKTKNRRVSVKEIDLQELLKITTTEDYQQIADANYGLDKFIDQHGQDYNYDPDNGSYYRYQEEWDDPDY